MLASRPSPPPAHLPASGFSMLTSFVCRVSTPPWHSACQPCSLQAALRLGSSSSLPPVGPVSPQPCHTLSLHLSPRFSEINANFFPPNIGSWVKITSLLPVALKFRDAEIFNHSLILVASLSEALSCFTESFMVAVKVYFYNSCIMFMTGVIFFRYNIKTYKRMSRRL